MGCVSSSPSSPPSQTRSQSSRGVYSVPTEPIYTSTIPDYRTSDEFYRDFASIKPFLLGNVNICYFIDRTSSNRFYKSGQIIPGTIDGLRRIVPGTGRDLVNRHDLLPLDDTLKLAHILRENPPSLFPERDFPEYHINGGVSPKDLNEYLIIMQLVYMAVNKILNVEHVHLFTFGGKDEDDNSCTLWSNTGINEAIQSYHKAVSDTGNFGNKTSFASCAYASSHVSATTKRPVISIIMTDGMVSPECKYDTKMSFSFASNYPIEFVIIGIGDGDGMNGFRDMQDLDDTVSNKHFDNIQFVEYNHIKTPENRWKENVASYMMIKALQEIPHAFRCMYYKHILWTSSNEGNRPEIPDGFPIRNAIPPIPPPPPLQQTDPIKEYAIDIPNDIPEGLPENPPHPSQ